MSPTRISCNGRKNVSRCPAITMLPGSPGSALDSSRPAACRRTSSDVPFATTTERPSLGTSRLAIGSPWPTSDRSPTEALFRFWSIATRDVRWN